MILFLISMAGCVSIASSNSGVGTDDARDVVPTPINGTTDGVYQPALPIISDQGEKLQLDATAAGTTQQLGVQEMVAISLESNPSTGYRWFAKSSHPLVIDQQGEAVYKEPDSTGSSLGAAGTEILYFTALSAGKATITLEYKRSWEAEVAPEKTIMIIVEVK
ncbi:MAG: hypothetical protein A2136_10790 [Chloroflexi bacterium RBG_16_54_11]|nr:MAG: hypothetical protein A2136_10790 [Chloroflexi bacterium RBG_16_54_11]